MKPGERSLGRKGPPAARRSRAGRVGCRGQRAGPTSLSRERSHCSTQGGGEPWGPTAGQGQTDASGIPHMHALPAAAGALGPQSSQRVRKDSLSRSVTFTHRPFSQDPTAAWAWSSSKVRITRGWAGDALPGRGCWPVGVLSKVVSAPATLCVSVTERDSECECACVGGCAGHLTSGLSSGQVRAEGGKAKPQLLKASPVLQRAL